MGHLSFKVGWQVDDIDGAEWAFFGTYTTSDAETLRYKSYLGVWGDLDAELTSSDNGA